MPACTVPMLHLVAGLSSQLVHRCYQVALLPWNTFISSIWTVNQVVSDLLVVAGRPPLLQHAKNQLHEYKTALEGFQSREDAHRREIEELHRELEELRVNRRDVHAKYKELRRQASDAAHQIEALRGELAVAGSSIQPDKRARWHLTMHLSVALAAAALRFFMLLADPLHRRLMFVVMWPAGWLYLAVVFHCLPNNPSMRQAVTCTSWAMLGYTAYPAIDAWLHTGGGGAATLYAWGLAWAAVHGDNVTLVE